MLRYKFVYYLFIPVFIFLFFDCTDSKYKDQSITVEQANQCTDCTRYGRNYWCVGDFQGCIAGDSSSCSAGSSKYTSLCNKSLSKFFANCKGCIAANKTWCVIKNSDLSTTETKCIKRVSNNKLWNGHPDCLYGNIYNKCVRTTGDDDDNGDNDDDDDDDDDGDVEVPADADLVPLPEFRHCETCTKKSNMGWCVSPQPSYTNSYCLPTSDESKCQGSFYKSSECPKSNVAFSFRFEPWNCKTCVSSDSTKSWCTQDGLINQAECIATADVSTRCYGATVFNRARFCTNPNETVREVHPLSKTCSFCKANGDKWCIRTRGSNRAAARLCVSGSDGCPVGSIEALTCDITQPDFFTHLPAVPLNLPGNCNDCTGDNAWCVTPSVKTCLPQWSFGFLCLAAAPCTSDNENRLFVNHPLHLPPKCDDCVNNNFGEWCITEFNKKQYKFCVSSAARDLCVGASPKPDCNNLKPEEKKGLIPTPIPMNCDECLAIPGYSWCVHSEFGEKIIICLPDDAVKALCKNGVVFRHCQIAPEDKVTSLGFFAFEDKKITAPAFQDKEVTTSQDKEVTTSQGQGLTAIQGQWKKHRSNDSPAFASLSLVAVSVVLIGFTLFGCKS